MLNTQQLQDAANCVNLECNNCSMKKNSNVEFSQKEFCTKILAEENLSMRNYHESEDESNEIGPIDLKLKDTKTGKTYTKRLSLEEYAAILYVLKVVEWR